MLLFNKLDNLKIKHKLFIVYFLLIFINVVMVSIVAYTISFTFIKEQSISILTQVQKQKELEIQNNLVACESIIQVLLHDPKIHNFVAVNYIDSIDEIDALQLYVDPVVKSILSSRNDGMYLAIGRYKEDTMEVIGNNYEYILSKRFATYELIDQNRKFYHILNLERLKSLDWFNDLYGRMNRFKWMQVGMDKEYDNISYVGEMRDEFRGYADNIGMMRVCVSIEKLLAEGETVNDIEGLANFIFNEDGVLITGDKGKKEIYKQYATDFDGMLHKDSMLYKFIGNKVFLSSRMKNGWTIVSVVPVVSVYKAASNLKYWFIVLDLFMVILLLFIAYIITHSFTKRLNNVTGMMQKFKKGNFDVQIVDNSNDELGFLSTVFNDMVRRMRVLIRDNYQSHIDKKDAQLKVLQEQIKPHMLYNSLSTISRLAERQDTTSIKKMVKALCQFYRLSLNKGGDYLSIYEEFEHLKAYLDVFSIRHKNSFRVHYTIDPAIYGYDTVKVLLQPFVENIFEHAVYDLEKPINIIIEGRSEGEDILFKITDDGMGMRSSMIDTLISAGGKGYGIKNVDERIKIHFGDGYGVRIFSIYGAGTAVCIRIPKFKRSNRQINAEGGEKHVESVDRG